MEYYLYILKSLDNNNYIGISSNPEKRLIQHNSGKTQSTKSRRPFVLIYKEKFNSRKELPRIKRKNEYYRKYWGVAKR